MAIFQPKLPQSWTAGFRFATGALGCYSLSLVCADSALIVLHGGTGPLWVKQPLPRVLLTTASADLCIIPCPQPSTFPNPVLQPRGHRFLREIGEPPPPLLSPPHPMV